MEGLSRILAAPVDLRLAGRQWWLHPLTLADFARCEQHLLKDRLSPVEEALRQLPRLDGHPDLQRELYRRSYHDTYQRKKFHKIPRATLFAWIETAEGLAFTTWLTLRTDAGRRPTLPRLVRLLGRIEEAALAELRRLQARVSGLDLFAQLDWPWVPPDEAEDEEEAKRPLPWARLLREFAGEPYFWGPDQVGRLTLYQLQVYRGKAQQLGGRVKMPVEEAKEFVRERQLHYTLFLEQLDAVVARFFGDPLPETEDTPDG